MGKQSKRHIAVSPYERAQLEEAKKSYEVVKGPTNWGNFLKVTTGHGLAALGIYILTRPCQRTKTTWDVKCPVSDCIAMFIIYAEVTPLIVFLPCPVCETKLLIDFRTSSAEIQKSGVS